MEVMKGHALVVVLLYLWVHSTTASVLNVNSTNPAVTVEATLNGTKLQGGILNLYGSDIILKGPSPGHTVTLAALNIYARKVTLVDGLHLIASGDITFSSPAIVLTQGSKIICRTTCKASTDVSMALTTDSLQDNALINMGTMKLAYGITRLQTEFYNSGTVSLHSGSVLTLAAGGGSTGNVEVCADCFFKIEGVRDSIVFQMGNTATVTGLGTLEVLSGKALVSGGQLLTRTIVGPGSASNSAGAVLQGYGTFGKELVIKPTGTLVLDGVGKVKTLEDFLLANKGRIIILDAGNGWTPTTSEMQSIQMGIAGQFVAQGGELEVLVSPFLTLEWDPVEIPIIGFNALTSTPQFIQGPCGAAGCLGMQLKSSSRTLSLVLIPARKYSEIVRIKMAGQPDLLWLSVIRNEMGLQDGQVQLVGYTTNALDTQTMVRFVATTADRAQALALDFISWFANDQEFATQLRAVQASSTGSYIIQSEWANSQTIYQEDDSSMSFLGFILLWLAIIMILLVIAIFFCYYSHWKKEYIARQNQYKTERVTWKDDYSMDIMDDQNGEPAMQTQNGATHTPQRGRSPQPFSYSPSRSRSPRLRLQEHAGAYRKGSGEGKILPSPHATPNASNRIPVVEASPAHTTPANDLPNLELSFVSDPVLASNVMNFSAISKPPRHQSPTPKANQDTSHLSVEHSRTSNGSYRHGPPVQERTPYGGTVTSYPTVVKNFNSKLLDANFAISNSTSPALSQNYSGRNSPAFLTHDTNGLLSVPGLGTSKVRPRSPYEDPSKRGTAAACCECGAALHDPTGTPRNCPVCKAGPQTYSGHPIMDHSTALSIPSSLRAESPTKPTQAPFEIESPVKPVQSFLDRIPTPAGDSWMPTSPSGVAPPPRPVSAHQVPIPTPLEMPSPFPLRTRMSADQPSLGSVKPETSRLSSKRPSSADSPLIIKAIEPRTLTPRTVPKQTSHEGMPGDKSKTFRSLSHTASHPMTSRATHMRSKSEVEPGVYFEVEGTEYRYSPTSGIVPRHGGGSQSTTSALSLHASAPRTRSAMSTTPSLLGRKVSTGVISPLMEESTKSQPTSSQAKSTIDL